MLKKFLSVFFILTLLSGLLASCGGEEAESDDKDKEAAANDTIQVQIEMEDGGIIKLELYPDVAPITCENFVKLAKEGFYDGLTFHRVISGFMIQGGDPEGNGTGGSDETIKGEFSANGVENNLSHTRGVISMARSKAMDSASSQFFICHADSPHLDGNYAAFGRVTEGMDVVDAIASVETDENDKPLTPVVMKSVTVIEAAENSETAE